MKLQFYKYQATGNDFILIDNRSGIHQLSSEDISRICDRKFGVGADGLILIEEDADSSFNVNYYNSDGSQSLCGNGSRAAVQFAATLGLVNGVAHFNAYDGIHEAEIQSDQTVRLKMHDVAEVFTSGNDFLINTGSPHFIRFVKDLKDFPVVEQGRAIRYSDQFKEKGINVNFVELLADNTIFVRTYERGVEDETLSCGTGVTAAALAASYKGYSSPVKVQALGGVLSIEFKANIGQPDVESDDESGHIGAFTEIFLIGPAKMVFEGYLEL